MNASIPYKQVLFINDLGKNEGILDFQDALARTPALTHNLVLVNDSNKASPICRALPIPLPGNVKAKKKDEEARQEERDRGSHAEKMEKRHQDITKIMQCKTNISDHDLDIKIKKAVEMLQKGYKV
jgi:translation initiation factor IF-3